MKKGIVLILLTIFLVFIGTEMVFGYSPSGRVFGGKIISTKSTEIASLEATGYTCTLFGTSISIIPIGSPLGTPTDFFIPSYVTPKTRTTPRSGQLIIGRYSGKTSITCILESDPPQTKTVSLDTITLFGTSR